MTVLNKRRALGRGLDALIPGGMPAADFDDHPPVAPIAPVPAARKDFFLAPIEDVHPSPEQPRHTFDDTKLNELAQSIVSDGIIQPLVVRERSAAEGGGYWLIAGERRWRAAQRAGLHDVPVVVREVTPAKAFEMALVENVQRDDLNPIEEAEAYRRLGGEFGYTQEQLAERVGKDRTTITNSLRLLKLPASVRGLVQDGSLSMGHARALLSLDDPDAIEVAARKIVAKSLSVRATEELCRQGKGATPARPEAVEKSPSVRDLEQKLTRTLGARVQLHTKGKGGKIEIAYSDLDDLDRILDQLYSTARN